MAEMTHRKRIINRIKGKSVDRIPFFPDLSDWYQYHRYTDEPWEWPHVYGPGVFISPKDEINKRPGIMPEKFKDMNLFEIHRELNCGIPIHGYTIYYDISYNNVEFSSSKEGRNTTNVYKTSVGEIREVVSMADDHSSVRTEHLVKTPDDFPALKAMISDTVITQNNARAQKAIDTVGDLGYVNMGTWRSPLAMLLIDYMGLEAVTFGFMDEPEKMEDMLEFLGDFARKTWESTAAAPGRFVYHCDNMDEFLFNPGWYRKYCFEFYQEMTDFFHEHDKIVLTHMDGRIKNLLPYVKETGFDVIDGCTPAPVNDFEPRELAAALGPDQVAYCGVPAPFFIGERSREEVLEETKRYIDEMGEKLLFCVGDIMPQRGDITLIEEIVQLIDERS